jgi:hypothetical protein
MSEIITCDCGAKVRLPRDKTSRSFRCPACKLAIPLSIDAQAIPTVRLGDAARGVLCPTCQCDVTGDEPLVICPECQQTHHLECWAEIGGCATYGCRQAPALPKAESTSGSRTTAAGGGWGDEKRCPNCGELIKASALRCRFCRSEFDTTDPLSASELRRRKQRKSSTEQMKWILPLTFLVSIPGCVAPLMLIFAGCLLGFQGPAIRAAGPVYSVLGYAALAISGVYTLLMLGFLAYSLVS